MARPLQDGLLYFSLDVDLFSDIKIKVVRAKYGTDGIVLYLYLLCEIYKNGYYVDFTDDLLYVTMADLNMSEEKTMQILNFLLKRSLFNDKLFRSDKVLTASSIQRRYQTAKKTMGTKRDIEVEQKYWLLKETETLSFIKVNPFLNTSENKHSNSENNPINSKNNPIKKSKVNNSIVNNSNTVDVCEEIKETWLSYVDMRKAIKSPLTDKAMDIALSNLEKLAPNDHVKQKAILEQSIFNSWKGLFPLKSDRYKDVNANQSVQSYSSYDIAEAKRRAMYEPLIYTKQNK